MTEVRTSITAFMTIVVGTVSVMEVQRPKILKINAVITTQAAGIN